VENSPSANARLSLPHATAVLIIIAVLKII
jgi:hypothetical protein